LERLFDIALDVVIIAIIVISFLWGGYTFKTERTVVTPAQASARY